MKEDRRKVYTLLFREMPDGLKPAAIREMTGIKTVRLESVLKWLRRNNLIIDGTRGLIVKYLAIVPGSLCWEHGLPIVQQGKGVNFKLTCPVCARQRKGGGDNGSTKS